MKYAESFSIGQSCWDLGLVIFPFVEASHFILVLKLIQDRRLSLNFCEKNGKGYFSFSSAEILKLKAAMNRSNFSKELRSYPFSLL